MAEAQGPWVRPPGVTLAVWNPQAGSEPLFVHRGRWLHPLFDLGLWLEGQPHLDRGALVLRDRILGRAAAFLVLRWGIRDAGADVVSRGALEVWGTRVPALEAGTLVDRIDCRTEGWLEGVTDPEAAWALLAERRRLALEASAP